jgi:membrane-associated protease RseP (regulator of RpoE activity)
LVANLDELVGAVLGQDAEVLDEVRPISAIGLVGAARGSSVEFALGLIAVVNVFVGIVNLVPLYPLDGGHFAVALYEKVRGRSADVRRLLPVAVAVFLFLATVGLLGIYFDIVDPLRLRK